MPMRLPTALREATNIESPDDYYIFIPRIAANRGGGVTRQSLNQPQKRERSPETACFRSKCVHNRQLISTKNCFVEKNSSDQNNVHFGNMINEPDRGLLLTSQKLLIMFALFSKKHKHFYEKTKPRADSRPHVEPQYRLLDAAQSLC